MKKTIYGCEFSTCTYISPIDSARISGIHLHDLSDTNHDGDAVCGNAWQLPETEEEAMDLIANEHWESDGSVLDTVEFSEEN